MTKTFAMIMAQYRIFKTSNITLRDRGYIFGVTKTERKTKIIGYYKTMDDANEAIMIHAADTEVAPEA